MRKKPLGGSLVLMTSRAQKSLINVKEVSAETPLKCVLITGFAQQNGLVLMFASA